MYLNKKIYIYGTASGGQKYYQKLNKEQYKVLGFLDTDKTKIGTFIMDLPVNHITCIRTEYDEIHIASSYSEIYFYLLENKVEPKKIKIIYETCLSGIVKSISEQITFENKYILTSKMRHMSHNYLDEIVAPYNDYSRYKTLQLIWEEVEKNQIKGDIAEVGVYRGDFAQFLNRLMPNKKLYLFDTFEGFDLKEKEYEIKEKYTDESFFEKENFEDTNVDIVLKKMVNKSNCIVCKGHFPNTAQGIDAEFAIVSIDVDLYVPIYEALKYFVPRLKKGGYILMHDYNNIHFHGVKKAVEHYENNYGHLCKVPISDKYGSLIITK